MSLNNRFIVCTYIDWEVEGMKPLTEDWVKQRLDIFSKYTLKSLLNQSFSDFEIWALCGSLHKKITQNYNWNNKVKVMYDKGYQEIMNNNSDYISFTRIDSDDLYHRDAMKEVKDNLILTNELTGLIFRKNLLWDTINKYIGRHIRNCPPFFTHIYPKKLVKNWNFYCKTHFVDHGRALRGIKKVKELSDNKACVVKHNTNISNVRKNIITSKISKLDFQTALGTNFVTNNESEMLNILSEFGIQKTEIYEH